MSDETRTVTVESIKAAVLKVFSTSDGAGWEQFPHTEQWADKKATAIFAALPVDRQIVLRDPLPGQYPNPILATQHRPVYWGPSVNGAGVRCACGTWTDQSDESFLNHATAAEPDWEALYVEESERYVRLSNEYAALRGSILNHAE